MGLFKKDKKAMTFDNAMEERRSIYIFERFNIN